MNIFILDYDLTTNAQYHCDKHIVKMPLETAQLLCTAIKFDKGIAPYKATHINHPCNIWTRKSKDNYIWLCNLGLELCDEYTYRYNKIHKCRDVIRYCLDNIPSYLKSVGLTDFALAMPDEYKVGNVVDSYRCYYKYAKNHLHNWKYREVPNFINAEISFFGEISKNNYATHTSLK